MPLPKGAYTGKDQEWESKTELESVLKTVEVFVYFTGELCALSCAPSISPMFKPAFLLPKITLC